MRPRGELLGGVDPYDHPGFTPGFHERVADLAHYRLHGRHRESVQRGPSFPHSSRRGALSTCGQFWITRRATFPLRADRPRQWAGGQYPCRTDPCCDTSPPGPTPHSIDRVLPHSPRARPDGRPPGEGGRRSLGALLRNTREQCTNLSLPVAPVSPQRADRGQFPAFAHRVTVLGSTRNIVATSAGVNSDSASGVRADICVASPPGPVLRSYVPVVPDAPWGACRGCPIWPTETILPSPAVTRRPPGAKFLCRDTPLIAVT